MRDETVPENPLRLFDWQQPAQLLVFPQSRRLGKIRRVAEVLEKRHGADAEGYWRSIVRGLADQLVRAGIPDPVVDQELRTFFQAVQLELHRRAVAGRFPDGDSAA